MKEPKPAKTNGYDPAKVQEFVGRIENLHNDIASEKGSFMQICKDIHSDINLVFDEAKEAGIPKKALKKVITARALEAKAAAVREALEGEDQDSFDLLRHALGDLADTPLGAAALKPANGRGRRKADKPPEAPMKPVETSEQPF
jgi:uncharacterized protein (UPF0335 family)